MHWLAIALDGSGCGRRIEVAFVADNEAGKRQRDFYVEVELPALLEFAGISSRGQDVRQRQTQETPAPHKQTQAAIFRDQSHAEDKGSEPFAKQVFESGRDLR